MTVTIRPLADLEEREACLRLQESIWGDGFTDRVPPSILMIAQETGGVASGAFEGERLVGFVFGLTGLRDGRKVHWSDMLAVLPEARHRGLGVRLKLHQRDLLLPLGVETVFWTFDPLVSRNAHLNLHRLGAVSRTYRRDLYGRSNSPLHAGIGTDRLLAEWWIAGERVADRLDGRAGPAPPVASAVINPPARGSGPPRPGELRTDAHDAHVEIVVPADMETIRAEDAGLAREWRANLRGAFEWAFDAGYTAIDLIRGTSLSRYVLTRGLVR
jgi:predicted GNAT superfamily acetyltransferase